MSDNEISIDMVKKLSALIDMMSDAKSTVKPLIVGRAGVAEILGTSVDNVTDLDRAGKIPRPLVIGRTNKWLLSELEDWLKQGAPARNKWEMIRNNCNVE